MKSKRILMSIVGIMISAVSVGFFKLAAFAGAGTILTAFFMGPLIDFFNCKVSEPFLGKY